MRPQRRAGTAAVASSAAASTASNSRERRADREAIQRSAGVFEGRRYKKAAGRKAPEEYEEEVMQMHNWVIQRKKIGLSRKSSKSRENRLRLLENEATSVDFITTSFERKECVRFTSAEGSRRSGRSRERYYDDRDRDAEEEICACGRTPKEHREQEDGPGKGESKMNTIVEEDELADTLPVISVTQKKKKKNRNRGGGRQQLRSLHSYESQNSVDDDGLSNINVFPTNAFGEIVDDARRPMTAVRPKYLRLSDDSSMPAVHSLLQDHWYAFASSGAAAPSLVLNFLGGDGVGGGDLASEEEEEDQSAPKSKRAKRREREAAQAKEELEATAKELAEIWSSVSAILITRGLDTGATKMITDAFQAKTKDLASSHSLKPLGISPWGMVQGRKSLLNRRAKRWNDARYDPDLLDSSNSSDLVELADLHSFFLLADNGLVGRRSLEGAERLQTEVCKYFRKVLSIPVVTLFFGCGLDELEMLLGRLRQGDLCILIKSRGKEGEDSIAEFILEYALSVDKGGGRNRESPNIKEKSNNRLKELIADALMEEEEDYYEDEDGDNVSISARRVDSVHRLVTDILKESAKLMVHDPSTPEKPLDQLILMRLLDDDILGSGGGKKKPSRRLEVAIKWRRPDLAREILRQARVKQDGAVNGIMTDCLMEERTDFVEVLTESGFSIKRYLSPATLRTLYNRVLRTWKGLDEILDHFVPSYEPSGDQLSLHTIHELLTAFLFDHTFYPYEFDRPDFRDVSVNLKKYKNADPSFEDPSFELFLWAALCDKTALLPALHARSERPVLLSAVAAIVFDGLSVFRASSGSAEGLKTLRDEYVQKTNKLLAVAHDISPVKTLALLENRVHRIGDRNLMQLAYQGNMLDVIANHQCQSVTLVNWQRGFTKISPLTALLCVFCPILIYTPLVKFRVDLGDDGKEFGFLQKIYVFFKAPVVKFVLSLLSTLTFTVLYSYVALYAFRWEYTIPELIVYGWVAITISSEFRELFEEPAKTLSGKVKLYLSDIWNKFDLLIITLLATAFVFKNFRETFWAGRVAFAFSSSCIWMKLFRFYHTSWSLGPKLHSLVDMVPELAVALCLMVVFMFAYLVAVNALIDPYRTLEHWYDVLEHAAAGLGLAYFQMYGELQLDLLEPKETPDCTAGQSDLSDYCKPADLENFNHYGNVTPVLLGIYLLFTAILLLNMLIAVFTSVFEEVQSMSVSVWKWEMYRLVQEFDRQPTLPAPLVIIENLFRLFKGCWKCCCRTEKEDLDFYLKEANDELQLFEKSCAAALAAQEATCGSGPDEKIEDIRRMTADIVESVKEGDADLDEVKSRLRGLEKAVAAVLRRLDEL